MISIIAAVATNGVIGYRNGMPWHISADLKRFKRLTLGHTVVMGRKTYESLGSPLPDRLNVVISRNTGLSIEGVTVVDSIDRAVAMCAPSDELFIIGGGQIYRQCMEIADRLYITVVEQNPVGDILFPHIDSSQWQQVCREDHGTYSFVDYVRNRADSGKV